MQHPDEAAIAALSEEFGAYKYVDFQEENSANINSNSSLNIVLVALASILLALRRF